jgi:hypothetical protein
LSRRFGLSNARQANLAASTQIKPDFNHQDLLETHFLFRSLCNRLSKSSLNRFQISGEWLQAHFEIIEDRLLVGFRCGDFLEPHVAHHDLVAPDRCQALDHVAHCPLSIFVGAIGVE